VVTFQRTFRVGETYIFLLCFLPSISVDRFMFSRLQVSAVVKNLLLQQSWETAWLVVIWLAGVVAISPHVADPDLWGHIQYGHETWQAGLASHTTHSYVATNTPWINHEIVAELALSMLADLCGAQGLLLAKMFAGATLLLALLVRMRRENISLLGCAMVVLFTANGLARFWSLRPQLFSFLAYAALLSLLSWCFENWEHRWQLKWSAKANNSATPEIQYNSRRLRWLWCVPLLMGLWTNTHGGFLAGECLYTAYLLLRGCELWSQRGAAAIGLLKRFALMIVVAWLATFFNPYGYAFHVWLWHDLAVPRPEIVEWLPPDFSQPSAWPFLCLIGMNVVCILGSRRSHDFTHWGLLALTLWQALSHERHIPFYALSCAFFLPAHLESALERWGVVKPMVASPSPVALKPQSVIAFGLMLTVALSCVSYKLWDRLSALQVQRTEFPVDAVAFMAKHELRGKLVCTMNWAQYLLAAFPQTIRVHIDGRLRTAYSQEMIDTHFDFLYGEQPSTERYRGNTPVQPERVLAEHYPNLVLLHRGQPHAVKMMEQQSRDWVLLYQDGLAQLWGRASRYANSQSSDFLPERAREIHNKLPIGWVAWPAFPQSTQSTPK
jgi:hypothetical protein